MEWGKVLTIVGANFAMILWCMKERRSDFLYITKLIDEIKNEMKDFHTKLALQDLEFKMRLSAIEERNKKGST